MSHASGGTCEIDGRFDRAADNSRVAVTRLIERNHETLVAATTVIERSAADLYRFWRDPANLPKVIPQLDEVIALDAVRSLWIGSTPQGRRTERICTLSHDTPGRIVAWAAQGASLIGSRRIVFTPLGERSTRVTLTSIHAPSTATLAEFVTSLQRSAPVGRSLRTLNRLHEIMEVRDTMPFLDRLSTSLGTMRRALTAEHAPSGSGWAG
jgi:uncharacterized membrane protein